MLEKDKKKNDMNLREACQRVSEIKSRLRDIADALEADKSRDALTEAENNERKALLRELDILEMKIRAHTEAITVNRLEDIASANNRIRECIRDGRRFELKISRAVSDSFGGNASGYADPASSTNPAGVTIGDIVTPLYSRIVLSAIGAPLLTGLSGNYAWPVVESFAATINDEGVALGDTKIPLGKLIAKPERVGIAVPVTREAINETGDLITLICTQYMPMALAELMNKVMFSGSKVSGATNLVGPFVNIKSSNKKTYSGNAPTLSDILSLKAIVLGANIQPDGLCYVMTETTKAMLESTPKWDGCGTPIIDEKGNINGVPVFCCSYAGEGKVLFGAFKYAPQALFGEMSFIVDPYTLARKNSVDFVLNADYALSVLRQEAFAELTKSE